MNWKMVSPGGMSLQGLQEEKKTLSGRLLYRRQQTPESYTLLAATTFDCGSVNEDFRHHDVRSITADKGI